MKIAAYAIMKNEEKHVRGWLDNTRDADVAVLVDTGSTDNTWQEAVDWSWYHADDRHNHVLMHRITVEPFRFDVARNSALSLVPPDIDVCISLDLDERLSENWRRGIESAWRQVPDATQMAVQYHTVGLQSFWHNSRIHKRNGYLWMDPCHEHLWPWMIETNEVHSKSVSITQTRDLTKKRNYLPLLAAGLNEDPGKGRRMFYYAREMMIQGEYEIAAGWFRKYLEGHKAMKIADWWESNQAEAMLKVCEGALNEQQAHRG